MARYALQLAFGVLGFSFMLLKINEMFSLGTPLVFALSLLLPAAVLGSVAWWTVDSFARRWPVVLCAVIASVGMFTTGLAENRRGTAAIAFLLLVLPLSALIVRYRCWWMCAKTYVLATTVAVSWALWIEYQMFGLRLFSPSHRFGFLWSMQRGIRLANPNVIGIQLALTVVLAFAIYLRETHRPEDSPAASRRIGWSMLGCLGVLGVACILTASRGASLAMFGGLVTLMLWETKNHGVGRTRGLVATICVLTSLGMFAVTASGFEPWQALGRRLGSTRGLLTASGRVGLWLNAYRTWTSDPRLLWIGTGTGAAPDVLSLRNRYVMPDGMSIRALDTHNTFCEWVVSYGIVGLSAGAVLALTAARRAFQLDRRDGRVTRRAILLCFFLASMNLVTFYDLFFVAAGSLILAMLSDAPAGAGVPAKAEPLPAARAADSSSTPCHPRPEPSFPRPPFAGGGQPCLPSAGS